MSISSGVEFAVDANRDAISANDTLLYNMLYYGLVSFHPFVNTASIQYTTIISAPLSSLFPSPSNYSQRIYATMFPSYFVESY